MHTDDDSIFNVFAHNKVRQFMGVTEPVLQPVDSYNYHFGFTIFPTLNSRSYYRRNYSLVNQFGDVAAIYAGLSSIFGLLLVNVFQTKNVLNNYFINSVFRH